MSRKRSWPRDPVNLCVDGLRVDAAAWDAGLLLDGSRRLCLFLGVEYGADLGGTRRGRVLAVKVEDHWMVAPELSENDVGWEPSCDQSGARAVRGQVEVVFVLGQ